MTQPPNRSRPLGQNRPDQPSAYRNPLNSPAIAANRPRWPFALGLVGGAILAAGQFLPWDILTISASSFSRNGLNDFSDKPYGGFTMTTLNPGLPLLVAAVLIMVISLLGLVKPLKLIDFGLLVPASVAAGLIVPVLTQTEKETYLYQFDVAYKLTSEIGFGRFVSLGAALLVIVGAALSLALTVRRPNSALVARVVLAGVLLSGIAAISEQKAARADVLLPNQKSVSYCYQFANLKDFPDYVIVATYEPIGGPAVVKDGECVSFYKLSRPTFYATKAAGFVASQLPKDNSQRTFFSSNPAYIPSTVKISAVSAVDKKDPRDKVVDVLKIVDITSSELKIEKSSVIYTYENGQTETLPYLNQQDRPQPGSATPAVTVNPGITPGSTAAPSALTDRVSTGPDSGWLWFGAVPLLALAAIVFLVVRRKPQGRK